MLRPEKEDALAPQGGCFQGNAGWPEVKASF